MTSRAPSPAAAVAEAVWAEIDRRFEHAVTRATDDELEHALIELAAGMPGEAVLKVMLLGPAQQSVR